MHDRIAALPHEELVGDEGRGAERIVAHLDAIAEAAEARRRFEFVMARLTHSQHELFALIMAGMSREQIAAELGVDRSTLSHRENSLLKKVEKIFQETCNSPPVLPTRVEGLNVEPSTFNLPPSTFNVAGKSGPPLPRLMAHQK